MYKVKFHIPCTVNVVADDRTEAMIKAFGSVDTKAREDIEFEAEVAIHPALCDSIELATASDSFTPETALSQQLPREDN